MCQHFFQKAISPWKKGSGGPKFLDFFLGFHSALGTNKSAIEMRSLHSQMMHFVFSSLTETSHKLGRSKYKQTNHYVRKMQSKWPCGEEARFWPLNSWLLQCIKRIKVWKVQIKLMNSFYELISIKNNFRKTNFIGITNEIFHK